MRLRAAALLALGHLAGRGGEGRGEFGVFPLARKTPSGPSKPSESPLRDLGFRVSGLGFRVSGLGFRGVSESVSGRPGVHSGQQKRSLPPSLPPSACVIGEVRQEFDAPSPSIRAGKNATRTSMGPPPQAGRLGLDLGT